MKPGRDGWMNSESLEELHFVSCSRTASNLFCVHVRDRHSLISVTTPAAMVDPTYRSMKRPNSL